MPNFEGLWLNYRTSFSKASPIKSNATSLSLMTAAKRAAQGEPYKAAD
jgi:hypothetical protein